MVALSTLVMVAPVMRTLQPLPPGSAMHLATQPAGTATPGIMMSPAIGAPVLASWVQ